MGVFLTSACISLAISELTRSIWRSLQGSPLLPSPSLAQPSMAQIDLVATACPHLQPQSAPSLDPMQAPAIMSSLIWTCHTSPDTYPRHAVTFCPAGAKKLSRGFLPLLFAPTFACCFILPFLSMPLVLSRSFCPVPLILRPSSAPPPKKKKISLLVNSPAFPLWPLQIRLMCLCLACMLRAEETRRGLDMGVHCQLCSIMHVSLTLT